MGTQATARHSWQRGALVKRERQLATLAQRQHGVLSRRQLLKAGLSSRTIRRRVEAGRLHPLHREVYALGHGVVSMRGHWLAAVLACGEGAVLSHRSAAALLGLIRFRRIPVEVSAMRGRERTGISVHEGGLHKDDRTEVDRIPTTTVARTLFDLAEVVDERKLEKAFEEADRLRVLRMPELEAVCARGYGRRALAPIRRLIDAARMPDETQSPLEDRVLELCRKYEIPLPVTGTTILGREVDAFWPAERLMVESDSWKFHGHREAFERDRTRDAAMQAEGYRVVRLTDRRLKQEPTIVANELRRLLAQGGRAVA